MKLEEVTRIAGNRRAFLKGAGMAGIGRGAAMIGTELVFHQQKVEAASNYSDEEILNFALNLEYLEAEFYAMATWGTTLVNLGVINEDDTTGPTTGGNMVKDFGASPLAFLSTGLREDEIDHVIYLRSALAHRRLRSPRSTSTPSAMATPASTAGSSWPGNSKTSASAPTWEPLR